MSPESEMRDFLVSRRARLTPEQAGVDTLGSDLRRVAGLRREEVALLAGISVGYYARLERGQVVGVSESVLDALSRALRLDTDEREHLRELVQQLDMEHARTRHRRARGQVRPTLQHMLDAITDAPACISDLGMDIVAQNALGRSFLSAMHDNQTQPANCSRFIFLDPRARDFHVHWESIADVNIRALRRLAENNPAERRIFGLVGELAVHSQDFRTRWARIDTRQQGAGVMHFAHPVVGRLDLTVHSLKIASDPGLTLTVFSSQPGSPAHERLQMLASWSVDDDSTTAP